MSIGHSWGPCHTYTIREIIVFTETVLYQLDIQPVEWNGEYPVGAAAADRFGSGEQSPNPCLASPLQQHILILLLLYFFSSTRYYGL